MSVSLSEYLVRDGALPAETVRTALGRQIVYGGALDTALLEMGAIDEPTLWGELSLSSGLPIPSTALIESADPALGALFDLARSTRCRAVPVARQDDTLQLLCGEPVEGRHLEQASAELGLDLELFVVPEVRLKVARQVIYGQPMPPRFLRLLARLLGAEPVRRWSELHGVKRTSAAPLSPATAAEAPGAPPPSGTSAPPAAPVEAVDPDEPLHLAAADPRAADRLPALRALRDRLAQPRTRALAAALRADAAGGAPAVALAAVSGLAELRDPQAVGALIGLVKHEDPGLAHAAQQALQEITKQDFGASRRRWTAWWEDHGQEPRTDWLFEGLSHSVPEIRASAAEELRQLTGEYFGYHFDLHKRERDQARRRWQTWWTQNGGARAEGGARPAQG
jgi:hypothetical protein